MTMREARRRRQRRVKTARFPALVSEPLAPAESPAADAGGLARRAFDLAMALAGCDTLSALATMFGEAVAPLGMTSYASGMVTGPRAVSGEPFHFLHWPADWLKVYQDNDFAKIDPIPRWAIVSGAAVSWSEVLKALPAKDPGHRVVEAGRPFHFTEGYVTPVRTGAGHLGLASVAGERAEFGPDERLYLETLSRVTLRCADALVAAPVSPMVNSLTDREMECAMLLGQGLTDRKIAAVLKLATATARFHVDNARKKMGAKSRAHLVSLLSSRSG